LRTALKAWQAATAVPPPTARIAGRFLSQTSKASVQRGAKAQHRIGPDSIGGMPGNPRNGAPTASLCRGMAESNALV
jgi:hypothetical protein